MTINGLVSLLVYLIILGLIFYLLDWLIGQIPMMAPVRVVIRALLALVLVIFLLEALGVLGPPPFSRSSIQRQSQTQGAAIATRTTGTDQGG